MNDPIRQWNTRSVAPAQALDYWAGAVCEGFLEMQVHSSRSGAFEASLASARLGAIGMNAVQGSGQDVWRTPMAIRRSRADYYYLLCKLDEDWTAAQRDRRARLQPGDLLLVDSRRPYEFHFPTRCDTVSLELPIAWVERWLADPAAHCGHAIDGRHGWGLALSAYARTLRPAVALAPPLPAAVMADQLGALLALALEGGAGAPDPAPPRTPASRAALAQQVRAQLQERLGEPGLAAGDVAAALGVSPRSLHRALAEAGTGFAPLLLSLRLAEAQRLLADRRYDRLTVGEIGRRAGWLDASHFVRLCRQHLGATPAALRRARGGAASAPG